jgi:hypothetical protein
LNCFNELKNTRISVQQANLKQHLIYFTLLYSTNFDKELC